MPQKGEVNQETRIAISCDCICFLTPRYKRGLKYTAGSVFYNEILCILADAVFIGDRILCFLHRLKGFFYTTFYHSVSIWNYVILGISFKVIVALERKP